MTLIEKTTVDGWEVAIRGLRNSFDSHAKSDSAFENGAFKVGAGDLALMAKLAKSGDSHAKFLRYLIVTFDITAPRYWWAEFDTYKVGTVRNSCSTMHTITKTPFSRQMFSAEHLTGRSQATLDTLIDTLNFLRDEYNQKKDTAPDTAKALWYQIIQLLPASFNQKATILLNYQVLRHIYIDRKSHKLTEWREFCQWVGGLPNAGELITYGEF